MQAKLFYKGEVELGEGIMWHKARKSFLWVDIHGKTLYECRWSDKKIITTTFPYRVTVIFETEDSEVVSIGVQGGLVKHNLTTGKTDWIIDIEKEIPDHRTNDGACDASGRIWVGTMQLDLKKNEGALYSWERDGRLIKRIDGMTLPNGMAWSTDNKTMYLIETDDRVVNAYDYDLATGDIKFNRVAVSVPEELGFPDGMCMDDEGMLWIAHYSAFGVYRHNPLTGKMLDKIDVPVPNVTSCAFGGDDNKTMLITTARQEMSPNDLAKYPGSGSVFIAEF